MTSSEAPPRMPLTGIRVLELGRLFAAPMCAQILGDLGADVVKVERKDIGDDFRAYGPPFLEFANGELSRESGAYLSCNRNKRSIAIDFAVPEGQEIIRQLASTSHIFIENFKAGTLDRYGLADEQLKAQNPDLIYLSITGFGQSGPYRDRPGTDGCFQAMSGLQSLNGQPDGPPERVGLVIVDLITGLYSTIAALAALRHREIDGGVGQSIDMALLDCAIAATSHRAMDYLIGGEPPARVGNRQPGAVPTRYFECRDGKIHIQASVDAHFKRLCDALGLPQVAADSRFATRQARREHEDTLSTLLEPAFAELTLDEAYDALVEADVICGPVYSVPQALEDPHVLSRGMIVDAPLAEAGGVRLLANPIKFGGTPIRVPSAPPRLGADTELVLADWLGLSKVDIEDLKTSQAI